MSGIEGKVALITGATSGIGEASARRLAADGARIILWARRYDRLVRIAEELEAAHGVKPDTAVVDVRDRDAVRAAATDLIERDNVPDVLLNNAGLASGLDSLQNGHFEDWDRMIDTNVKGLLNTTRAILPEMIRLGRGQIINIGSTAGHLTYPNANVYAATKAAVLSLTEGINLDVAGTPIRVSSVDPGFVETEFSTVRFHGDAERARNVYEGFQPLGPEDVADAVAWVIGTPAHVNVLNVLMMPSAQRNVYVVDRGRRS